MNLASVSGNQVAAIGELIAASAVQLSTASVSVPGMRSMPFRFDVDELLREQRELERAYDAFIHQPQPMGALFLPILAAGSVVASLTAWAWKHHEETSRVEARTELYRELVEEQGMDAEKAAQIAFGTGGGITDIMNKLLLLGGLGIVAYFLLRKR